MTLQNRLIEALEGERAACAGMLHEIGLQRAISIIRAELSKPLPEGELKRVARAMLDNFNSGFLVDGYASRWEDVKDEYMDDAKVAYAAIVGGGKGE